MTTDPAALPPKPEHEQEQTAELLGEVLDLVEEATARITDQDVETRLRRLLDRVNPDNENSVPSAPASSPDCADQPCSGTLGHDDLAGLDTLDLAHRQAAAIVAGARSEAEEQQDAALSKAAEIVKHARDEAGTIISEARQEAAWITQSALAHQPGDGTNPAQCPLRQLMWWRHLRRVPVSVVIVSATIVATGLLVAGIAANIASLSSALSIASVVSAATLTAAVAVSVTQLRGYTRHQIAVAEQTLTDIDTTIGEALLRDPPDLYYHHDVLSSTRLQLPFTGVRTRDDRVTPSFWCSLTRVEQQAITSSASQRSFPSGAVLFNEGDASKYVVVIRAGWVKVRVGPADRQHIIAIRGPGDLIGEAALTARSRSATIVALDTVHALLISTERFAVFLAAHPRVQGVLERHIYDRLIDRSQPPAYGVPGAASPGVLGDQNCSILLTDIADFGRRADEDQVQTRQVMYRLLRDAFESARIPRPECHWEDRGEGVLIVIPPTIPISSTIDPLIAYLASALRRHNRLTPEAIRLRLRVALHVGPVVKDAEGASGTAIVHTARLMESPILKRQLSETAADVAFIASSFVYDLIIRHNPGYADPGDYQPIKIQTKESTTTGWMNLLGAPHPAKTKPDDPHRPIGALPGLYA